MDSINEAENAALMKRGELYYAFTPRLVAARKRCLQACGRFNSAANAGEASRRRLVELWNE